MKMLNRYLNLQQQKLDSMQQRQSKLQHQHQQECDRLSQLQQHASGLGNASTVNNAMGLQNLSAVRTQLQALCEQQGLKVAQADQEVRRQQQACVAQLRYNKGLEVVRDKQQDRERRHQIRQEQKHSDELTALLLQNVSPFA
ncbi:flagellar FliJ family protein [Bowmanella pacifica]|uniref:Flagellar FliJ protein n=1 Tax=Bowmanella pacifica TaxID=502051 RepID=A0A917YXZ0_9ALTE|nr:flagellar FliJ family protein [Bowmanella pacifica]GGO69410.1 hypothetical protein GCM10010982_20500 [Bowmanella pacifica]